MPIESPLKFLTIQSFPSEDKFPFPEPSKSSEIDFSA